MTVATTPAAPRRPSARLPTAASIVPGLALAVAVAAVGELLGSFVPIVGAPVFAILGGITVALVRGRRPALVPGIRFASSRVLQASVVVLGTTLSLRQVVHTGVTSLPVMLGSLAVALGGAVVAGRALGVDRDTRTLVGVGTGICGVSAIAATDSVIEASEADVAYAVATIFTFNVAAVLTFPTIGHLLHLTPHGFGLWAGTAINDVSSVVAAATIFGHGAAGTAVVVKLTRTLMIIPITLVLGWYRTRRPRADVEPDASGATRPVLEAAGARAVGTASGAVPGAVPIGSVAEAPSRTARRLVPLFIVWFVVAVVANTVGLVPVSLHALASTTAQWMITIALAAIGCSTHLGEIRRAGFRPLALGAVLWVAVGLTSIGLQAATVGLH
ncbi:MAG: YeiH family protein [Acidimicrobiales bacterium]